MTTTCERCTRPMADTAYVCTRCCDPVRADLAAVPSLAVELEPARYRQTRYGTVGGRTQVITLGSDACGLREDDFVCVADTGHDLPHTMAHAGAWQEPWDDRVREVEQAVTNTLTTVARDVAETRGLPGPASDLPVAANLVAREHPAATAARWLVGQVEWIRHQRDALATLDELRAAVRSLRRVVDRPADSWWAGPCNADAPAQGDAGEPADGCEGLTVAECGADLYGAPGAETIRCRACGARYDARERRDWLFEEAKDVLGHAELIARAVVRLEIDVTAATVRGYARHSLIVAHGTDNAGRPQYRLGDVLEAYRQVAEREARRVAKRQAKESAA